MAKKLGTRTLVVHRAPEVDRLSSSAGSETTHEIEGCSVLPRTSYERERGWVILDGRMVIAPYGSDVTAKDEVSVDGVRWEVDGEAGDYENRRGVGKATIFYLKRTS